MAPKKKEGLKILFSEHVSPIEAVWGKFGKDAGTDNFSYGVACIAGYSRAKGFINIKYIDPNLEGISKEDYIKLLKENKFDVVAMPSFTPVISSVFETIKIIKQALPECITVMGGVHASILPERTMNECKDIDFIVIGEGELTFNEILETIINNGDFKKIDGLIMREGNSLLRTKPRAINEDITSLPIPAYDIFPLNKYKSHTTHSKVFPTYGILVSRGCCFNCSFCNATEIHGKKVRFKFTEQVIGEILYLKQNFGAKGITFYDSTFTINKAWVREFCQKLIEQKVDIAWDCYARTDKVDEELLKLMRKAGCWGISFGAESANQKSLDILRKNNTVETNTKGMELALKAGLIVTASYILCLPGENEQDTLNTINYAKKIGTHLAIFFLPIPYPETQFYNMCKNDGTLNENAQWSDYQMLDFDNPVYVNPLFGKKKMVELYNYAHRTYYLTPKVFLRNIAQINSWDAVKKYFRAIKCYFKFR